MGALSTLLETALAHPLASLLLTLLLYALYTRYGRADLRTLPGPFLASITDLHRVYTVSRHDVHTRHIAMHKRHGPLLRLGPNLVSVADPAAIGTIFGISRPFLKSEFYPVQQLIGPDGRAIESMFNTTSPAVHASLRRPVAHMYSASALLDYEPLVDRTLRTFRACVEARGLVGTGVAWDLGEWLQWFAFDVVGEMTFGRRLGFLEGAQDIEGVCASIESFLHYSVVVGQMPFLDRILRKNPLARRWWNSRQSSTYISRFALKRLSELESAKPVAAADASAEPDTFISKFLSAHRANPAAVPRSHVVAWTVSNVFAGSDTTAITLRAVFYFLLRHPAALATLCAELDTRLPRPADDDEVVSWTQSQRLPYLDAVIRESMRLHPVTGTLLERVVPHGGCTVAGHHLAAGTIVGMTPWVLHRDREIYGADVDAFRPERWLDCTPDQRRAMERSFLGFGAGSRTCVGKNISRLEMYKAVPELLRRYEIELERPEREWRLLNVWFVKQTGVVVRMRRRGRVLGFEPAAVGAGA
ncbi:pisatin demethylase [Geopyxis carbonaria]|nr:pisatin demethylase [Geopyxis carbonaria]